jgi:hypothetical protein
VLLVVVVILLGLLAVADRIAVSVAEGRVADRLAGERPFAGRPDVSINGFPFLTQALDGVYDDIQVTGPGQPIGKLDPVRLDIHLHGVHLALSKATNHVDRVPVDRGDISVIVSPQTLAAASGVDGLTLTANGDQLTARGPVDVPGLGTITVSATGNLVITDDGAIGATLTSVDGTKMSLPAGVLELAQKALGFNIPLTDLPFQATDVHTEVQDGQVRIRGQARNIVLE